MDKGFCFAKKVMGTPMTRIERINADYFTPFVFFVAWWEIMRIIDFALQKKREEHGLNG